MSTEYLTHIAELPEGHFLFTSESVNEGHPDKLCDQISDAVLDACFAQDPESHVACETCAKTNFVMIFGEISTTAVVNLEQVVRDAIKQIGYDNVEKGLDYNTCEVIEHIMLRNLVSKTTKSKSYSLDGIKRPAFVRISPFKAISSRSPLISLLLPSAKDKIREIDELRRKILNKKPRLSPIRH